MYITQVCNHRFCAPLYVTDRCTNSSSFVSTSCHSKHPPPTALPLSPLSLSSLSLSYTHTHTHTHLSLSFCPSLSVFLSPSFINFLPLSFTFFLSCLLSCSLLSSLSFLLHLFFFSFV